MRDGAPTRIPGVNGSWDYPAGSSRQRLLSRISTASWPAGRAHRRRSRGPVSRTTVITRGSHSAAHVLGQQVSDQRERCLPLILGEIVPGPGIMRALIDELRSDKELAQRIREKVWEQ